MIGDDDSGVVRPSFLEAALAYAHAGWSVIPLKRRSKAPRLATWKDFQRRCATRSEIEEWWKKWPQANIGLICGQISGRVVIDVDGPKGAESLERHDLPDFPVEARTGRAEGGRHLYCRHPGRPVKSRRIAPGLDVKGDGGYIVAPPSVHESGRRYEFIRGSAQTKADDLPVAPEWTYADPEPAASDAAGPERNLTLDGDLQEGDRNRSLYGIACRWVDGARSIEDLRTQILGHNARMCRPALEEDEVNQIVDSAWKKRKREATTPLEKLGPVDEIVLIGGRLQQLEQQPDLPQLLNGLISPEPRLGALIGRHQVGKTTFLGQLLMAIALQREPWFEAGDLPKGRALLVTAEQSALQAIRFINRSLPYFLEREIDATCWREHLGIVARHKGQHPSIPILLRWHEKGRAYLRALLLKAREEGNPFALVGFDSLTRLLPAGIDTYKASELGEVLKELDEIAMETQVHFVMLVHRGHSDRKDPASAARDSSVIGDITQWQWLIEKENSDPRLRRLTVDGNEVVPQTKLFRVAREDENSGVILRFEPVDQLWKPEDFLTPGEWTTVTELARRLRRRAHPDEDVPSKPGGGWEKKARSLLDRWKTDPRVGVEGTRARLTNPLEPFEI